MPDTYLKEAYEFLLKKYKDPDEIEDSDRYQCKVYRQISSEMIHWQLSTVPVLNINYWNLDNLTGVHGHIRKPKIYTNLFVTTKNNLALDWYPYNPFERLPYSEGVDYTIWSDQRHGQEPYNRLLMVRKFSSLLHKNKWDNIDKCLIRAAHSLLSSIYEFVEYFTDVNRITDLYLDYNYKKHRLEMAEIRDAKEAKEKASLEQAKDEIKTICEEFSITPQQVVEVFKANDMKWAPTARKLSPSFKKQLSTDRLKKLIKNIYYHTDIYSKILDKQPKGFEPKSGEIIQFPQKQ